MRAAPSHWDRAKYSWLTLEPIRLANGAAIETVKLWDQLKRRTVGRRTDG
ncbi:MAG: hypothetical protein ACJ74Y_09155 [Bryobacteraceae bacterium]